MVSLDAAFSAGLLLSVIRAGAFVMSTPIFPRAIPMMGRLGLAVALGLFFASPLPGSLGLGRLIGAVLINIAVGVLLGFLTSLIFAMFPVAGGILDMTSGLGISAVIDPNQGIQAAVFNRLFNLTAITLFFVIGGDHLLVHGMGLSLDTIPLHGSIVLQESAMQWVIMASERMIIAGAELALPAVAALFLSEVIMGIASRFAPASNVFILGLPLRIMITLLTAGLVVGMFPMAGDGALRMLREAFVAGLRALGVGG